MPHENPNPYQIPRQEPILATLQDNAQGNSQGDATGGVIPYKNPHALVAYYLGIVALFPLIGVPFGIASIILGFIGLKKRRENPIIKGSVHAWIGILGGFFSLVCGGVLTFAIVAAMLAENR